MEVIQERLEREYNLNLITTMPNVEYIVRTRSGEELVVDNPAQFPPEGKIEQVREPYVKVEVVTPSEFIGAIMALCQERRVCTSGWSTSPRSAPSCATTCPSPRS